MIVCACTHVCLYMFVCIGTHQFHHSNRHSYSLRHQATRDRSSRWQPMAQPAGSGRQRAGGQLQPAVAVARASHSRIYVAAAAATCTTAVAATACTTPAPTAHTCERISTRRQQKRHDQHNRHQAHARTRTHPKSLGCTSYAAQHSALGAGGQSSVSAAASTKVTLRCGCMSRASEGMPVL